MPDQSQLERKKKIKIAEEVDILYVEEEGGGERAALTNGEFISLSKHHVSRGEVTMDDMFLLVNITKSQHQL